MRADGKMADASLIAHAFDDDDNDSLMSGLSGISADESLHSSSEPPSKRPRQQSGGASSSKSSNMVDLTQSIMPNNSATGTTGMVTFGLQDAASRSFLLVNSFLIFNLIRSLFVIVIYANRSVTHSLEDTYKQQPLELKEEE